MVLQASDVGRRIVVRHRIGVQDGRSVYNDVLGVLESWSPTDVLVVRRRDGSSAAVDWSTVVAGKPVPWETGSRRPPHTGYGLMRIAAAGWPAVTVEELGDWLLRAADGFTGRANSVVPAGDPGVRLDAALSRVLAFYSDRGLPPKVQVIPGTSIEGELGARGWQAVPSGKQRATTVEVQVAPLARLIEHLPPGPSGPPVEPDVRLDEDWVGRYRPDLKPPVSDAMRRVLEGPVHSADVPAGGTIRLVGIERGAVPEPPGPEANDPAERSRYAGIGRGVVTGPWLGLAAVEVAPGYRRRGLGLAIMAELCRWGHAQGASWAYLQVGSNSEPALALYEQLGFRTAHQYSYYSPPSPAAD